MEDTKQTRIIVHRASIKDTDPREIENTESANDISTFKIVFSLSENEKMQKVNFSDLEKFEFYRKINLALGDK